MVKGKQIQELEVDSTCSVDPLVGCSGIHHLECFASTFVKKSFWTKTFILIVTICTHAFTKNGEICRALLLKNVLSWCTIVFSGEAMSGERLGFKRSLTYMITVSSVRVDFLLVPPKLWTMFSIGIL